MRLRECFDRHGSDRGWKHRYDRFYEPLIAELRPQKILEIGVFRGAGVAAWLDYLPGAEIACIDIFSREKPNNIAVLNDPRVTWYSGDSRTTKVAGDFDLIIDDGAHVPLVQRDTFLNMWRGCPYVIEDVWPIDAGIDHPWIRRPEFSLSNFLSLMETLQAHGTVKRHDLRKGGAVDSYLLEVR